ncbi:MAG: hypothetical protein IPI11_15420 [Haliscomenobacter sp.]|nr:hypothetical protein [Haliscomenobacter sp.]
MKSIGLFFAFLPVFLAGQTPPLTAITLSSKSGLRVQSFHTSQQALQANQLLPLFSLVVNGKTVQSTSAARSKTNGDSLVASLAGLEVNVTPTLPYQAGCRYTVLLKNASSKDTLTLENFIPWANLLTKSTSPAWANTGSPEPTCSGPDWPPSM